MAVRLSTEINPEEWLFFLTGGISLENPLQNKIIWLQDLSWDELCRLDNIEKFKVCLSFFNHLFISCLSSWYILNRFMYTSVFFLKAK